MNRGLTLLELVITLTLAGILAVPIGLLLGEQVHQAVSSQETNPALQLARYEMERLDSLNNFFENPDLSIGSTTQTNFLGTSYDMTRTVSCIVGNCTSGSFNSQGVKLIEVTVTKSGATEPSVALTTYRTKHVSFGSP